ELAVVYEAVRLSTDKESAQHVNNNLNFEVSITVYQNLEYQQNLKLFPISIIVLFIHTIRYENIEPLLPKLNLLVSKIEKSKNLSHRII
ncbi:MAG: hypothetical protein LH473_13440, partial [Chitinophagales bacterium]|nr:hypothetical protein [Chitinophagales bacterium]